jgi:hypothetical protein
MNLPSSNLFYRELKIKERVKILQKFPKIAEEERLQMKSI